jgi:hypothetical protein
MLRQLFLLSFICIAISSCAQSKYGIKKITAFYALRTPGNIPVDENGRELYSGPDTVHTIYIEVSGKNIIKWEDAWKNNNFYTVISTKITQAAFEAGMEKTENSKVIIKPAAGNTLWQLSLSPSETKTAKPPKSLENEIILQGKYNGKKIIQKINKLIELVLPPSY